MSINIDIFAEREIEVVKTGVRQTQYVDYKSTWQIPTEVTGCIMQATDRKQLTGSKRISIGLQVSQKMSL